MSENKNIVATPLCQTLQGFYKVGVVDENHNVIWEQEDWGKNLIVNTGMNGVATYTYANIFNWADAGIGIRLNSIPSADTAATADGAGNIDLSTVQPGGLQNFTASTYVGYASAVEEGDMIKFDDGGTTEARVLTVAPTVLTVTPNITISPSTSFTIWKTSQTALNDHKKYAGSGVSDSVYVNNWPNTGTSSSYNNVYHRRTFDFPKQTIGEGAMNFTEIGLRFGSSIGTSNLFSRIVLPFSVYVDVNQRLRLSYELKVSWYPTSSINRPNVSVVGWPAPGYGSTNTNGSESLQKFDSAINHLNPGGTCKFVGYVNSAGQAQGGGVLEPSNAGRIFVSTDTRSLQPFLSSVDRDTPASATVVAASLATYIPLSFYTDRYVTFTEAEGNYNGGSSPGIASIGIGRTNNPNVGDAASAAEQAFCFVFEQTQSKLNTQTLTLDFRSSWGRILS